MNGEVTAFLLTDSAILALGLRTLLLSIPPIQSVECLVDADAMLDRLGSFHPALIVIDTSLVTTRLSEILSTIRVLSPHSHQVIFTDDMEELRRLNYRQVKAVFIKGADPVWLARSFENILRKQASIYQAS